MDRMGHDISHAPPVIEHIAKLLEFARKHEGLTIIHTREGHMPNLADLPDNKRWRSAQGGGEIGSQGPLGRILIRGEKGWDIIPELYPIEGEIIIDKPGKSAFYATELEHILHTKGIRNVVITGVTTECCVLSTTRDANEREFEGLTLRDCVGSTIPAAHEAALNNISQHGGLFGCVGDMEFFCSLF